MRVVSWPRQSGKTTLMLRWLQEDEGRVLYVYSEQERRRLLGLLKGNFDRRIIVANVNTVTKLRGRGISFGVGVDNLDLALASLLGFSVDVATITDYGGDLPIGGS